MNPLTPRRSRWLALGLLLLVILLLLRLLLVPLWQYWFSTAAQIDTLENRQAVYTRLIAALPQERERLAQLQANAPVAQWYLDESTPALAAARLQQLLHSRAGQKGVQVVSTQIINIEEDSTLQPVAIQAQLRADLSELVALLYQLETDRPLLFIDSLAVLANPRAATGTSRSTRSGARTDHLDIRLNLIGYTPGEVAP
ncbi:MAG: hypothetical protein GYB41_08380 [Oceanospirillales bacterium]|nr:hypothetical protein [Oceanospirillales bacterium]